MDNIPLKTKTFQYGKYVHMYLRIIYIILLTRKKITIKE